MKVKISFREIMKPKSKSVSFPLTNKLDFHTVNGYE